MRYIQMIKRCKLPLKKATSDLETHGEEHAKRCKLSTVELKTPISVDERLGHLKNSAVARLLVEGRLPAETVSSPKSSLMNDTAMDLSKSGVLGNVRGYQHDATVAGTDSIEMTDATAERLRTQMGAEMEALKKRGSSNEVRFAGWKCRYCPFSAHSAKKLYSHYQFHQQLLTSQSSKPHLEWLSAYRQSKDFAESNLPPTTSSHHVTSSQNVSSSGENASVFQQKSESSPGFNFLASFPKGACDAENLQSLRSSGLSLRYLLGNNNNYSQRPESAENSASGCLRSIVQEVMKKDGSSPTSSGHPISPHISGMDGNKEMEGSESAELSTLSTARERISPKADHFCQDAQGIMQQNGHANVQARVKSISDQAGYNPEGLAHREWDGTENERRKNVLCDVDAVHPVDVEDHVRNCIRIERVEHSQTVLQRPLSRASTSSYTSSTTSEEINVTDIPSQNDRPRKDSLLSNTSESGPVRLISRKRSHSVESERSSLCSPTGQHLGYLQVPREHLQAPNYQNQFSTSSAMHNNSPKSPRLECVSVKREEMDTRPNNSPIAVISSTGTPPPMQWNCNPSAVSETDSQDLSPHMKLECSVQCDLLVPPPGGNWRDQSPEMIRQAEMMDYQYNTPRYLGCPSVTGCIKCPHCGIAFDDSVLHSIHMGCHNHSDPFICNVCGEQCFNKYGFYTHIMRGHHSS